MPQKLTLDLKEYLDEQFQAVKTQSDEKFAGVNKRFDGVDKQIEDLKKNVSGSNKRINRVVLAIILIAVIFLFHLGESSGSLLKDVVKFL